MFLLNGRQVGINPRVATSDSIPPRGIVTHGPGWRVRVSAPGGGEGQESRRGVKGGGRDQKDPTTTTHLRLGQGWLISGPWSGLRFTDPVHFHWVGVGLGRREEGGVGEYHTKVIASARGVKSGMWRSLRAWRIMGRRGYCNLHKGISNMCAWC